MAGRVGAAAAVPWWWAVMACGGHWWPVMETACLRGPLAGRRDRWRPEVFPW